MSSELDDRSGDTVRLLRPPPRVFTDPLGRNVWMGEVEALELEPVQVVNTDPYNSANTGDPWTKARPTRQPGESATDIPGTDPRR